jgi:putative DNA primase/helicase
METITQKTNQSCESYEGRFAVSKDLRWLLTYDMVGQRWRNEYDISLSDDEVIVFPAECRTPSAAKQRIECLRRDQQAQISHPTSLDEGERVSLLREALAKNEKGAWILVPARITDFLLNAGSPLEVHTFKDNKDIVTYNKVADNGVWNMDGPKEIEQVVSEFVEVCGKALKEQLTRFVMLEVLAQIQWKTYIDRETFKSPPGKIPLLNGVYDLASGKLEPHSQENNFLYQSPVKYDPAATCPTVDRFLEQVLGYKKQLAYEMAGYAIAESNPNKWQRAFMLIGPGDNGKSTFLNLVTVFLGKQNVSQQTLQALVENRFAAAALDHKLANIVADIGDRSLYKTAMFKALTGGDGIAAEHKFKDFYDFVSRAILMFSCNVLPESYDDSDAYHKRWVIAQFENVFTEDRKDPELLEKLTTPTELSGFFNKAIAAYKEMQTRGTFTGEGASTAEKRESYSKLSDPVQCFLDGEILFQPDGLTNKQVLFEQFNVFCQQRHYGRTWTQKRFFKKFREKAGDQIIESRVKDTTGFHHFFKGIQLREETLL